MNKFNQNPDNQSIYPTNYSNQLQQNECPYPTNNSYPRNKYTYDLSNNVYPNYENNFIPHPSHQQSNPPYAIAAPENTPYPPVTLPNSNFPSQEHLIKPFPTSTPSNTPYPFVTIPNSHYPAARQSNKPYPASKPENRPYPSVNLTNSLFPSSEALSLSSEKSYHIQRNIYKNNMRETAPENPAIKPIPSIPHSGPKLPPLNHGENLNQSPIMPFKPQPEVIYLNQESPYIKPLTVNPIIPPSVNQNQNYMERAQHRNFIKNAINQNNYSPHIRNQPENIPYPTHNSSNFNNPLTNITPSDLDRMEHQTPYPSSQGRKIPPTVPKITVAIKTEVLYSTPNGQIVPQEKSFSVKEENNDKKKIKSHINNQPIHTLKPNMSTNAVSDSIILHESLKRLVCNKEAIRNIIARRNPVQRDNIKKEYQSKHKNSLIDKIKRRLTDPYKQIISCLIYSGTEIDAYILFRAPKFIDNDVSPYRDILATRTPTQIAQIKDTYFTLFKTNLDSAIKSDTSGSFRDILLTLLNEPRDQTTDVDMDLAKRDATDFCSRKFFNINAQPALTKIFCKRNYCQLNQTFKTYHEMSGKTVLHYLKTFIYGDYEKCLAAIYNFCKNPIRYHSKDLREGILKKSINHIIRVVVVHCDYNLGNIIQDYQDSYDSKFSDDLKRVFGDIFHQDTLDTILILIGEK